MAIGSRIGTWAKCRACPAHRTTGAIGVGKAAEKPAAVGPAPSATVALVLGNARIAETNGDEIASETSTLARSTAVVEITALEREATVT